MNRSASLRSTRWRRMASRIVGSDLTIGSATRSTRARMADLAVDNLLAALAGEPMPHAAA